jgi:predicted nucleotidyltransferase
MHTPDEVIREFLPLLRELCDGPCGIALGGSHARGSADAHSDVDVYLFAERVFPGAHRAALVRERLGDASGPVSWGADEPWTEGGTDFRLHGQRVEIWLRSAAAVDTAVQAALRGEIRRDHVFWTVMGFFSYAVLADLKSMRIVEDPGGMLARWKEEVAVYPEPLRQAILRRFMAEAAFWPGNPHYLGAVERGDVIYTRGIVQQVVHALIQVVFALNREYFPGEKKLAEALRRLPVAPPGLAERVETLVGGSPAALQANEQQGALAALVEDVRGTIPAS